MNDQKTLLDVAISEAVFVKAAELQQYPDTCAECVHYRVWREPRPYGDGVAYEELAQCAGTADTCPAVERVLQKFPVERAANLIAVVQAARAVIKDMQDFWQAAKRLDRSMILAHVEYTDNGVPVDFHVLARDEYETNYKEQGGTWEYVPFEQALDDLKERYDRALCEIDNAPYPINP